MSKTVISLEKAVTLLSLPVQTGCNSAYMLCPKCAQQHTSKRKTLNLNYEKGVFRCARCDFAGGTYDFIAFYTGWPENSVEKNIRAGKLANYVPTETDIRDSNDVDRMPISDLASLKQRHATYSTMLGMLDLAPEHRDALKRRGLTDADIDRVQFRSLQRFVDPRVLAKRLIERGLDLRGVPGFGLDAAGQWRVATFLDSGFLIPLRNGADMIQGFQIRFDHPNDKTPKYGYFTSAGMVGGASCSGWCSWSGDNLTVRAQKDPFDVILIEGPLKAIIVNALSGHNMLAVPGVSTLGKAAKALSSMKDLGLGTVYVAYDMDSYTNQEVAKALRKLNTMLDNEHISHRTMVWDPAFKGLDDWMCAKAGK